MNDNKSKQLTSKSIDYKDIQDRLIGFFERKGHLGYERIDVQTIPTTQYFKSVCFNHFECTKMGSGSYQVFYFTTADDDTGAPSREELPERWVNAFLKLNCEYAEQFGDEYPSELRDLVSSSVSQLCLKMGIIGA